MKMYNWEKERSNEIYKAKLQNVKSTMHKGKNILT